MFGIDDAVLIALALSAASMGANYQGQKKVDKARGNALADESRRRKLRAEEGAASAKSTADLLLATKDKEATSAAEQTQRYAQATEGAPAEAARSAILSNIAPAGATSFVGEQNAAAAKTKQKLAQRAGAMAGLESFGDVMTGNQIEASRNAADINQGNQAMQNWSQYVLPRELEAANTKGRDWNTLGDVLQIASMVTGMGALTAPAAGAQTAQQLAASGAASGAGTNAWAAKDLANWASGLRMPGVY